MRIKWIPLYKHMAILDDESTEYIDFWAKKKWLSLLSYIACLPRIELMCSTVNIRTGTSCCLISNQMWSSRLISPSYNYLVILSVLYLGTSNILFFFKTVQCHLSIDFCERFGYFLQIKSPCIDLSYHAET